MKTFITGLTGSGKTTTAARIAASEGIPHIDYDNAYGYRDVTPEHCRRFLETLPADCVVDAVALDPGWGTFNEWAQDREDVRVLCTVLPLEQWLKRIPASRHALTDEMWEAFWLELFPTSTFPIAYIDSSDWYSGGKLTHEEAMKTIDMPGMIRHRIKSAPEGYDAKYQSVPEVGFVGYERTDQTWNTLKPLAVWSSSSVVDCGCSHGYMLFRIRDLGCAKSLLGLDSDERSLVTARAVNRLREDCVEFRQWSAGDPIPQADITLCLNALHRFPNAQAFLNTLPSPLTFFEVDASFEPLISRHWPLMETFPSARPGRRIYRCQE